jgi:hypothetical protein
MKPDTKLRPKLFDPLKFATSLATLIEEAMQGIATNDDLGQLEHRMTIKFGAMLAGGLGLFFVALKAFP